MRSNGVRGHAAKQIYVHSGTNSVRRAKHIASKHARDERLVAVAGSKQTHGE
jgi:hypothetical protein